MSTDATTDDAIVEPDPTVTDGSAIADGTDTAVPNGTPEPHVNEDQDDEDDAGDGPGREAAKYRRRLRDTEAERDRLAEQVESLQRAEVERLAASDGLRPAALWASGVELADLLADDGTVHGSKVSAAIGASREQLGIPNPLPRNYVKNEGRSPGRPGKPSGKAAMVSVVMGRGAADD